MGLARGTVCYMGVTIPEGQRAILGENVPDKLNTPNNCKLDWSMQQHMTGLRDCNRWMSLLSATMGVLDCTPRERAKSDIYD